jgi:pimeloyl-ACP methyl ester carboxylesterase
MPPRCRIALTDWANAGLRFDYRGHSIFYRRAGPPAEVLLLIHGFPTSSWDWEALWPALTERYRVVAPDLIGFGFSAKPTDYDYSLVDQASLVEALLAHEDVASYHVLAHDYGDSVAQELLARQSEPGARPRLRSVAFLNGGLFPETHRPVLTQRLLLSPLGALLGRLASRGQLARNMRRIFGQATPPDESLIDDFWSLIVANGGHAVMHKLIRYMRERREQRARWVGALQDALVPLKLIDGAADPISGAHMAERYRQLVANADITLLDGIGHYPQIEAPHEVLGAYLEFRGMASPTAMRAPD